MKFVALSALIATAQAALGDDCFFDATICDADGLACATWEDSQYGSMASCEDCSNGDQQITDSFGDPVMYKCPKGDDPAPAPPSNPGGGEGEDKATSMALSAAVVLAASVLYA